MAGQGLSEEPSAHQEKDGEMGMFLRSRSLRMYNFAIDDLSNKKFLNIIKRAPQVHIDIVSKATEIRCRYRTSRECQEAFHRLQDCRYARPIRIVYDRDRLSCVVDWTLALDKETAAKHAAELDQQNEDPQNKSTWTSPLDKRVLVIQNIPAEIREMELVSLFPDAIGVWIATNYAGSSKGYAYMEFRDTEITQQVLHRTAEGIKFGENLLKLYRVELSPSNQTVIPPDISGSIDFPHYPEPRKTFFKPPSEPQRRGGGGGFRGRGGGGSGGGFRGGGGNSRGAGRGSRGARSNMRYYQKPSLEVESFDNGASLAAATALSSSSSDSTNNFNPAAAAASLNYSPPPPSISSVSPVSGTPSTVSNHLGAALSTSSTSLTPVDNSIAFNSISINSPSSFANIGRKRKLEDGTATGAAALQPPSFSQFQQPLNMSVNNINAASPSDFANHNFIQQAPVYYS